MLYASMLMVVLCYTSCRQAAPLKGHALLSRTAAAFCDVAVLQGRSTGCRNLSVKQSHFRKSFFAIEPYQQAVDARPPHAGLRRKSSKADATQEATCVISARRSSLPPTCKRESGSAPCTACLERERRPQPEVARGQNSWLHSHWMGSSPRAWPNDRSNSGTVLQAARLLRQAPVSLPAERAT